MGRTEGKAADSVWGATGVFTRDGLRGRGIAYALARAAVDFARAIECYPMLTKPGPRISWDEIHVGSSSIFAEAGFEELRHPTLRRIVMRSDV
jgi:GNAT superfamily N-acetyltransferase